MRQTFDANFSTSNGLCPRGHTYNLGQVEGVISNGVENKILQPVDNVEELLSQRSHGVGGGVVALRSTAIACDSNGRSTSFKKFP
jgi:hypothetical protein